MDPIFTVTVRKKKDILLAQLRTRQLGRMLGFGALEQARLVCLVFELVDEPLRKARCVTVSFQVVNRTLNVWKERALDSVPRHAYLKKAPQLVLTIPLPAAQLATEDIFWAMQQIQNLTRPDLFGEIRQQNADLVRLLSGGADMSWQPASPRPLANAA